MTTHPLAAPAPSRHAAAVRLTARLPGSFLGIVAALVLIAGGALLYAVTRQDDDGYLSTAAHHVAAGTYAIASDDLDVDLGGATWGIEDDAVRITAKSTSGVPVFVGIAPTADVQHYLGDVAHAQVRDFSTDPFRVDYEHTTGATRPALPGGRPFWSVSAGGAGAQSVTWPVKDGSWSVVVMNEDGSPGVAADVRVGAKVPQLAVIAWITTGLGVLGLALAAALLALGVKLAPSRAGRAARWLRAPGRRP
ncbi:MAG TPA: hypothetical protein VF533_09015 [Solirubrobacteraceae bacterium]|jgi:hypothetical protein